MKKSLDIFLSIAVLAGATSTHAASAVSECQQLLEEALLQQAITPCTRAAEAGDNAAQFMLGEIYDQEGNSERTFFWWDQAASAGYQPARNMLAMKYYYGGSVFGREEGWPQDYGKAFAIWHEDAQQGVASSQFMVGVMYHKGEGIPADFSEAWAWLKIALENGYKLATDVLIELSREITPQQKQLGREKLVMYRQRTGQTSK